MSFHCSVQKPWGIHEAVRNDQDCPRCGWTAPGPIGDAILDAIEAADEAAAFAADLGWTVYSGGRAQVAGSLAA